MGAKGSKGEQREAKGGKRRQKEAREPEETKGNQLSKRQIEAN